MIWYLIGQRMHGKNWNRQRYCWMQDIIKIPQADYSIFTGVRAVLAKDGIDFKKHAGVIAYFQKEYIKTGEFDKKYSKYLQAAFQIRNNCDYSDFFIVSREDAEEQYQHALEMLNAICSYLKKNTEKYSTG